jgi:hypothetical protein
MSPEQVRLFQAGQLTPEPPCDWNGKRLLVDGDPGAKTSWALSIAELDPRRQRIVRRACSKVGEFEEDGPNLSEFITYLLKRCGAAPGAAWCAAFASWCISVDGLPETALASAQALGRTLRSTTLVLPGDVMWFPTGQHTGHCGIVIGLGPGEVACVEGNSDDRVRLTRRLTSGVRIAAPLPIQQLPRVPPGLPLVPVAYLGTR